VLPVRVRVRIGVGKKLLRLGLACITIRVKVVDKVITRSNIIRVSSIIGVTVTVNVNNRRVRVPNFKSLIEVEMKSHSYTLTPIS
jgi:acyl-CoA hydrolase